MRNQDARISKLRRARPTKGFWIIKSLIQILDQLVLEDIAWDMIDVVTEIFSRIKKGVVTVHLTKMQKNTSVALLNLLNHSRYAVKKRCVSAIGALAVSINDSLLKELVDTLFTSLAENGAKKSSECHRIGIACLQAVL